MADVEELKKMAKDNEDTITISIPQSPWFYSTVVLLILLITSVVTGGFSSITGSAVKNNAEVNLLILNDKNCVVCDTSNIIAALYQSLPNLKVKTVDYNTAEGKQLANQLNAAELPVYLFDKDIEKTDVYQYFNQNNLLTKSGNYYVLRLPGNYIINAQESATPKLDLFVMSLCPYGNLALKNVKKIVDAFGSEIKFDVHYITTKQGNTFTSLHGDNEVKEDLRQLCVKNSYSNWFDYLYCFADKFSKCLDTYSNCTKPCQTAYSSCTKDQTTCSNEYSSCITPCNSEYSSCTEAINSTACIENNNMSSAVIDSCDSTSALAEDAALSEQLFISSSPTFLINDKYKVLGALPASSVQQFICSVNPELNGCKVTINDSNTVSAAGTC